MIRQTRKICPKWSSPPKIKFRTKPFKQSIMEYKKLLEIIADEVLNEYWEVINDFKEPALEVYDEYLIKRTPEIERLLESKLFEGSGIEVEIAKWIDNLMTNHPDKKKRENYNVKDWIREMAEIAKYQRENNCC